MPSYADLENIICGQNNLLTLLQLFEREFIDKPKKDLIFMMKKRNAHNEMSDLINVIIEYVVYQRKQTNNLLQKALKF